jgi:hypothetical protein
MTPYKILDDPTLGGISSKHAAAPAATADDDDESKHGSDPDEEYTDFLREVFMGPVPPPTPIPSDEELWSEIIEGGGVNYDVDVALVAAAAAREMEALRLSDIIEGRADGEEGGDVDEKRSDSDGEFESFLDCLDKEEGGGGGCVVGPVVREKEEDVEKEEGGVKDAADFVAFLSYFNSQQQQQLRQQHQQTTTKVDNFGFLPAQNADSVEAVWSKIVSGMSDERKMELMTDKQADPASAAEKGQQAEPPSWWQWLGFGPASVQVLPEAPRPEDDAMEQEESFV